MDIFRKFFGFSDRGSQFSHFEDFNQQQDRDEYRRNDEFNENFSQRGFDVFTDPLQMHRFFEQELDNMLRSFGFHGFDNFFSGFDNFPALGEDYQHQDVQPPSKDLRDQFLKHGYDKPTQKYTEKVDEDLDDKVKTGNFDSIFEGNSRKVTPFVERNPSNFFYGASQSMSTITHPDGTSETKQTKRDNEGNEETITCRILGDKQYCVLRRKDKQGTEEVTEQYINMDESEKDKLFGPKRITPTDENTNGFPYDKFFK